MKDKQYKMQEKFPMTITQEMYDAWQTFRRMGDPAKLQKILGAPRGKVSRPVVERALNYGHCPNPLFVTRINKYFTARKEEEEQSGTKLIQLAQS